MKIAPANDRPTDLGRPPAAAVRAARSRAALRSWRGLRDSMVYEVPAEHRASCAAALAYVNWQRTAMLSSVVAITNVFFGILPSVIVFATAEGALRLVYALQTGWHVFMVLFGGGIALWTRRNRPADEAAAGPRHQRVAQLFCAVMLFGMALFSVMKSRFSGDVSIYLIGVAAVGSLFFLPARFSGGLFMLTFVVLVAGMIALGEPPMATWMHTGEALVAISIFWVGSRLIYALKAMNHVQFATIARQTSELAAANRELARADQFKTNLLAAVAHDLRDPLNTIALSAQELKFELPPDSMARMLAVAIDDRTQQMSEFVANLLTDAVSDTHEIALERTPVGLPEFVGRIVEQHRALAAAKGIVLQLAVEESALHAPQARLDPGRFRQVLANLLTNAVKFSPAGKNVWVSVAHAPGEGHRIVVRDEGLGLTPEDQQRLFARFQRLSARPTGGEISTGLGLAIVKQLVQLHGGRVWASSAGRGCGASFYVSVP